MRLQGLIMYRLRGRTKSATEEWWDTGNPAPSGACVIFRLLFPMAKDSLQWRVGESFNCGLLALSEL